MLRAEKSNDSDPLTPSILQGGKFGHGFVSAGLGTSIGQAMGGFAKGAGNGLKNLRKFIAKTVVGGTISEATGGKFANGARSAAFSAAIQYAGTGLEDTQGSTTAPKPKIENNIPLPEIPQGDAVAYESNGGNYSKSAQKVPPPIINEVIVTVERISAGRASTSAPARTGYFHLDRCGSCNLPDYPTAAVPAFTNRLVNKLQVDIAMAAGEFALEVGATTVVGGGGAAAAGKTVNYFRRHPANLASALKAGANGLDEAGLVHDSIGVTSSGLPKWHYQQIVRDPPTYIRK